LLKRILIGIVRSFEFTGERARNPALKTKHFKLSKEQAWAEVTVTLKKLKGYRILHEVKNVGEIVMEKRTAIGRKQDITVALFSVTPSNTAIDIYSASRGSFGDLGSNYRTILEIYRTLEKKLAAYKIH